MNSILYHRFLAGVSAPLLTISLCASEIVTPEADVTEIASGYSFTEGGARDSEGNVYLSDIPNNRVHLWDAQSNTVSLFLEDSQGANGCWIDEEGNLIVAQGRGRQISKINADGKREVLVDNYMGKKFNSPNDLWIDENGGIYFSDPRYGQNREDMELVGEQVYYLSPDGNTLTQVTDDLVRPNGLIGSLDGKILYIADHGGGKTFAYDVGENGSLTNKRLFAPEGSDGVTIDEKGNIYLTTDAVKVYRPDGSFLQEIKVPKRPSNVCFGGKNGKTLFITARQSVYSLAMQVHGPTPN
ncbi:MAG: SMP-30/gluconolactonase/LRE family protein [Opitutae bacterium]|nr:SMP-30/gluconolactonase/LRE family protein [Opitutae bacterium]